MKRRGVIAAAAMALLSSGALVGVPGLAGTSININLRTRYLTLSEHGKPVVKFPVAIGAPESPTPPGTFTITRMEAEPVYHKAGKVIAPGPKNPVGVRYMAYFSTKTGEYAIHGTAWPNWVKIRAAVSLGCIRMLNDDVISLFNRVDVGTPVLLTAN